MRANNGQLIIGFVTDACPTHDTNVSDSTLQSQVSGIGFTGLNSEISFQCLEAEAFVEHVTEVQRQAAGQCGDAEHAENPPAAAGFDVEQCTVLYSHLNLA